VVCSPKWSDIPRVCDFVLKLLADGYFNVVYTLVEGSETLRLVFECQSDIEARILMPILEGVSSKKCLSVVDPVAASSGAEVSSRGFDMA